MYDYAITNGIIVDGSRTPPYAATLCIQDGAIAAITADPSVEAKNILDAAGKIVAPGFIDIHTHSDPTRMISGLSESKVYQGVTLELGGHCGISIIPMPRDKAKREDLLTEMSEVVSVKKSLWDSDACDVLELAARVDADPGTINLAMLVGHNALRGCVMGYDRRPPTPAEMERMETLLDTMLRQGAFGLSLGLVYAPGIFCETEELINLARVVKKHNRMLTVHMRNEAETIFDALDEVFRVTEASGVHLHISHVKLLGKNQWGMAEKVLEKINIARARGMHITGDQYPYDASSSSLNRMLPNWAHEGGNSAILERLADPATVRRMAPEIAQAMEARGGPGRLRIAYTRSFLPEIEELTLDAIAEKWKMNAVDAVVKILSTCEGSAGIISHSMDPDDVLRIMKEMDLSIGSDGSSYSLDPALVPGKPHRRHFGTFPYFLETVREHKLMPIQDAVYKITGLPARTMGLADRGVLHVGAVADITIFDQAAVRDRTTYSNPLVKPEGIDYVFVAGEPVIWEGNLTDARKGKFILASA